MCEYEKWRSQEILRQKFPALRGFSQETAEAIVNGDLEIVTEDDPIAEELFSPEPAQVLDTTTVDDDL